MTQWVHEPTGGRERGPRGLARAWLAVLVRPRRFFATGVAPGDQAPGLTFAISVALVLVGGRLLAAPEAVPGYGRIVAATDDALLAAIVVAAVAAVLVAPLVLHLGAALATLALLAVASDRAGVGETVQVVAYAAAPAVFAAVPSPAVQFAVALWGSILLAVGLAVVHDVSPLRGLIAALLPAGFVFGGALGGFAAAEAVLTAGAVTVVTGAGAAVTGLVAVPRTVPAVFDPA